MRRGLALALVLAAAALAGCDAVTSKTPLFGPADAAKAQLKPGLWAVTNGTCAFDERRPPDAWPDKCALAVEVRETDLLLLERDKGKPSHWNQVSYLLAGGDPSIMQTYTADPVEYDFYVFAPDRLDGDGRIVAAHVRQVLCGPAVKATSATPDSAPASSPSGGGRTAPLYPGLTATGSTGCTPNGVDGLRQAARAGADQEAMAAHWVRDGWR